MVKGNEKTWKKEALLGYLHDFPDICEKVIFYKKSHLAVLMKLCFKRFERQKNKFKTVIKPLNNYQNCQITIKTFKDIPSHTEYMERLKLNGNSSFLSNNKHGCSGPLVFKSGSCRVRFS